jgi:cellulose synthase/poly-beta-1,6-N-acetylglucosamine synthase-like glycosyltransferase
VALLEALLVLAALPFLAAAVYLAMLAILAGGGTAPSPTHAVRFDVIVPAHDEEAGVVETVRNLLALDYPRESYRVVVVADNCSDQTAERAAAAGARVLERHDRERRGKGYALAWAFDRLRAEGFADAFVVVDADTSASRNLLGAFAARVADGASALQARYGVRNRDASWRTRLMHLAFTLFHDVRSGARERLRLSVGLRGNGMCFTRGLLERVPHEAFSIVEDLEYGIRLGLAGVRVLDVPEAQVAGDMAASEQASRSQRSRWEGGRLAAARLHAPTLLARAVRERSLLLLDLALDLLVPPLSYLVLGTAAGLAVSLSAWWLSVAGPAVAVLWGTSALALIVYVIRGYAAAGLGWRGLVDVARVPGYMLWKLTLWARPDPGRRGEWVRTTRERDGRRP